MRPLPLLKEEEKNTTSSPTNNHNGTSTKKAENERKEPETNFQGGTDGRKHEKPMGEPEDQNQNRQRLENERLPIAEEQRLMQEEEKNKIIIPSSPPKNGQALLLNTQIELTLTPQKLPENGELTNDPFLASICTNNTESGTIPQQGNAKHFPLPQDQLVRCSIYSPKKVREPSSTNLSISLPSFSPNSTKEKHIETPEKKKRGETYVKEISTSRGGLLNAFNHSKEKKDSLSESAEEDSTTSEESNDGM